MYFLFQTLCQTNILCVVLFLLASGTCFGLLMDNKWVALIILFCILWAGSNAHKIDPPLWDTTIQVSLQGETQSTEINLAISVPKCSLKIKAFLVLILPSFVTTGKKYCQKSALQPALFLYRWYSPHLELIRCVVFLVIDYQLSLLQKHIEGLYVGSGSGLGWWWGLGLGLKFAQLHVIMFSLTVVVPLPLLGITRMIYATSAIIWLLLCLRSERILEKED